MKRRSHLIRSERGQTMTELALVMPLLFLLLFGIAQFGIVFNNYIQLTDSTRVGSRKAAVSRTSSSRVSDTTNAVRNSGANLNQSSLVVDNPVTTWAPGSDVRVCAHYPYSINLVSGFVRLVTLGAASVPVGGTLNSCTTERVE